MPILDLHLFYDQLTLGVGTQDADFLYQVLGNLVNVENFIQLYARANPKAINVLFKSLEVLHEHENLREGISNILWLIYTHCYDTLSQDAKKFIINYVGMSQDEINSIKKSSNFVLYYSEGIKRQKIEPRKNDKENADSNVDFSKKHERDLTELNPAKRHKLCSISEATKRAVDHPIVSASKKTRLFQ